MLFKGVSKHLRGKIGYCIFVILLLFLLTLLMGCTSTPTEISTQTNPVKFDEATKLPIYWKFEDGLQGWMSQGDYQTKWLSNYDGYQGVVYLDACYCQEDHYSGIYKEIKIPENAQFLEIGVVKSGYGGDVDGGIEIFIDDKIIENRVIPIGKTTLIYPIDGKWKNKNILIEIQNHGKGTKTHDGCPCGSSCCFEFIGVDYIRLSGTEPVSPTTTAKRDPGISVQFSYSPISGTAPVSVSFTDKSTGPITSWSWDFGDGTTSNERNPTHIYAQKGTYTVKCTVCGTGGCNSVTGTPDITVNAPAASGGCRSDDDCGSFSICCSGTCLKTYEDKICCGGKVYDKYYISKGGAKLTYLCCGDKVMDWGFDSSCCNGVIYNPNSQSCCNNIVYQGHDRCCGAKICPEGQECCENTDQGSICYDPEKYYCIGG